MFGFFKQIPAKEGERKIVRNEVKNNLEGASTKPVGVDIKNQDKNHSSEFEQINLSGENLKAIKNDVKGFLRPTENIMEIIDLPSEGESIIVEHKAWKYTVNDPDGLYCSVCTIGVSKDLSLTRIQAEDLVDILDRIVYNCDIHIEYCKKIDFLEFIMLDTVSIDKTQGDIPVKFSEDNKIMTLYLDGEHPSIASEGRSKDDLDKLSKEEYLNKVEAILYEHQIAENIKREEEAKCKVEENKCIESEEERFDREYEANQRAWGIICLEMAKILREQEFAKKQWKAEEERNRKKEQARLREEEERKKAEEDARVKAEEEERIRRDERKKISEEAERSDKNSNRGKDKNKTNNGNKEIVIKDFGGNQLERISGDTIKDIWSNPTGFIRGGTITNVFGTPKGRIDSDGTLRDLGGNPVGKIKDGRVYDIWGNPTNKTIDEILKS